VNEESDVRVLQNTVSRFEVEVREAMHNVRDGQNKVQDDLNVLRLDLPERFLTRREHEDWRRTVGERQGNIELEVESHIKEMKLEFEKRDMKIDAQRKLILTALIYPLIVGITVGVIITLVGQLSG
jgi:hypothetical protein